MKKNKLIKIAMYTIFIFFIGFTFVYADGNEYIGCGNRFLPRPFATITSTIIKVLNLVLPLVLIVTGSIDFVKAVIAKKDDDIQKGQKTFVSRLILGGAFFFVITFIRLAVSLFADQAEGMAVSKCLDCLISGDNCGEVTTDNPYPKS